LADWKPVLIATNGISVVFETTWSRFSSERVWRFVEWGDVVNANRRNIGIIWKRWFTLDDPDRLSLRSIRPKRNAMM
jgi:hypothetical protein